MATHSMAMGAAHAAATPNVEDQDPLLLVVEDDLKIGPA